MTTDVHHTQQDLALYAMQRSPVSQANTIHEHLQTCSVCRRDFADVCCELALCGVAVEQRKVPFGARGRFAERLNGAESTESIPDAGPASDPAKQISGLRKKSLLPVNAPVSISSKKTNTRSKVDTMVAATTRVIAARIFRIF